jgi:hypothetical protein
MRTVLLAGATIVLLAGPTAVHAADIYAPAPGYSQAPPAYQAVPGYAEGPPVADYGYEVEEVLPPARVYRGAPVYAQRLSRCWWEWGHQRCAPRRGW